MHISLKMKHSWSQKLGDLSGYIPPQNVEAYDPQFPWASALNTFMHQRCRKKLFLIYNLTELNLFSSGWWGMHPPIPALDPPLTIYSHGTQLCNAKHYITVKSCAGPCATDHYICVSYG